MSAVTVPKRARAVFCALVATALASAAVLTPVSARAQAASAADAPAPAATTSTTASPQPAPPPPPSAGPVAPRAHDDDEDEEPPPPRAHAQWAPPARATAAPPPRPAGTWDSTRSPTPPNAVGADLTMVWRTQGAYDLFAVNNLFVSPGLWLGRDIAYVPRARLALAVEAGWRYEGAEAPFAQVATARLAIHTLHAAAVARVTAAPWLEPHARVGVGASYALAGLAANNSGATQLDGSAWAFTATAGAGATINLSAQSLRVGEPGRRTAAFSLVIEGGVLVGTPFDLTLAPRPPAMRVQAEDMIPVAGARVGELAQLAPYFRLALAARF